MNNKIAALALVAGLGGEVGCKPEAKSPLEQQAAERGVDLDEVREIRGKLLEGLGVNFEGFCDNKGKDSCTIGPPYSVQCAIGGDTTNAYVNAGNAARMDVRKHYEVEASNFDDSATYEELKDGSSISCVKSKIDPCF